MKFSGRGVSVGTRWIKHEYITILEMIAAIYRVRLIEILSIFVTRLLNTLLLDFLFLIKQNE